MNSCLLLRRCFSTYETAIRIITVIKFKMTHWEQARLNWYGIATLLQIWHMCRPSYFSKKRRLRQDLSRSYCTRHLNLYFRYLIYTALRLLVLLVKHIAETSISYFMKIEETRTIPRRHVKLNCIRSKTFPCVGDPFMHFTEFSLAVKVHVKCKIMRFRTVSVFTHLK